MAIKDYFFNAILNEGVYDRVYNSEDVTSYLDMIVGNGVFPSPATQLEVKPAGGMAVIVDAGQGWIDGHKMINTTAMQLDIDASDVVLNRIDRVIFYVDHTLRKMGIEVKKGTPAASAVAPELTRNAQRYEMCLAEVIVNKQVTEIVNSMITDTRGFTALCGWVRGLVQNATAITKYENTYTTVSANQSVFNVQTYVPQYDPLTDILMITIHGLVLNKTEYTQSGATITLNTPIASAGTQITFTVYKSVDATVSDSVVQQVAELKHTVDLIEEGMYISTGADDNIKLSNIVKAFLNGGNDYRQLELDVYGDMACTTPATELTEANIAYWFDFNVQNSTRRVKLNFAHCSRIIIDANNSDSATDVFMYANNTEVANLQAVMNNVAAGQMIVGESACIDCAFWLNGLSNQTGTITGAEQGTFTRCRMSVTAENGIAYGFSGNGNTLRLTDCEVYAYNKSSAFAESVSVHVKANETSNILLMTNCTCPVTARNGYKQSNVVKVNSGYYTLLGNTLGKAAALYSTGTGKTELGTIYYTGGGSKSIDDMIETDEFSGLNTTSKTVIGAVNELNTKMGNVESVLDSINGEVI